MIIIKYLIHSLAGAAPLVAPLLHMFDRLHLNEFLHRTRQALVDFLVDLLYLHLLLVLHHRKGHKTTDLSILSLSVLPD
jgi:hypothetical protein